MKNKNPREVIIDLLMKVEKEETYLQLALKEVLQNKEILQSDEGKDKAFITEIAVGTMKYQMRIDYIINQFSKVPTHKMKPFIKTSLRIAVYQMLFMEKIPTSAAINEGVKLVHKRKMSNLAGFVNGVLRSIDRQKGQIKYPEVGSVAYLSVYYSLPEWMICMWLEQYDYETVENICKALNARAVVSIRVNDLVTDGENLAKILQSEGMEVTPGALFEKESLCIKGTGSIQESPSFKEGKWTVQDESAMLVGKILDPREQERVLDLCSAPGGKTTHLAQLMKGSGEIVATDIYPHKVQLIEKNAQRLGISNIKPLVQDGTQLRKDWMGYFDRVLLDAPCSGLGILKRKPDIRYTKTKEDLIEIAKIQKQLIDCAIQYVKPGGTFVYSTCTISSLENEQMIDYIQSTGKMIIEDVTNLVPNKLKEFVSEEGTIQVLPHYYGTDGFFIARFVKKG
jgi:16S rRNA (cytosine967-C5)-methyltransferase